MDLGGVALKRRFTIIILALISVFILLIGVVSHQYKMTRTDKFEHNFEMAQYYHIDSKYIKKQKKYLNEELEFVKSRQELQQGYYWLSQLHYYSNEYEKSNDYLFRALSVANTESNKLQIMIYMGISNNYYLLGDFKQSQLYYEKAQQYAIDCQELSLLADVYESRAKLYVNSLSRLDAVANLAQLANYLDLTPMRIIETNLLMMEISLISHNYEGVMYYLYQSWMLAQDQNNKMLEQYILYLGAMAYYAEERYEGTFELLRVIDKTMYDIDPVGYLYFLMNSYYQLHGYDESIKFLNEIREQESGVIDDYYDLLQTDLLISEGQYEEALKLLETAAVDEYSKLWRKTLELEVKRNLNVDIDLYSEYETLLEQSRTGALSTVSVYFIYSQAKDYLSQIRGNSVPYANEFYLDQEYLKEPSFEDVDQIMNLKDSSEKKQMFKLNALILIGVGILMSGYFYQRRVISRLKREIEHSKKIDALTQSLSYEWLDEEIHSLIKEHETLQVMLFDLESFQKYNDTYGYMAGNRILRQTVDLLKSTFDEGFVVRYNGHQFIVMLFDQEACIHEKMNQAIEAFHALDIRFNTGITKGQLLMRASGLSYQLSNHFDLDRCLKEVQRHMKSLKDEDE